MIGIFQTSNGVTLSKEHLENLIVCAFLVKTTLHKITSLIQ